ncbi:hypothetical protein BMETH_434_1 [methanotrophic bacterial endosymbiont of Bathymodiolus sp.]|nr:hypothetical protein BMETH_434_1 [methanotrophic bacterial endosymbiont of Bathymodiolus sp.]
MAKVHDQRIENPLKSVPYYRTNQRFVGRIGWAKGKQQTILKMDVVIILTHTMLSFINTDY